MDLVLLLPSRFEHARERAFALRISAGPQRRGNARRRAGQHRLHGHRLRQRLDRVEAKPRLLRLYQMQEALCTSTHDVQMVLNYLALRDDLDAKAAGMFSQGSGGAIAILAAAVDPRIVALDVLNPWGDWPDWLKQSPQIPQDERPLYLKPEFLKSVAALDPVMYLPQLKLKSLRIQQVMDESVTPSAAKDKIAAAAPKPDDVARYKDTVAHEKVWRASGLSGWLHEQMRPSTVAENKAQ